MNIAPATAGIPIVQSTTDRGVQFPTPAADQRVYNKGTNNVERYTGTRWTIDLSSSPYGSVMVQLAATGGTGTVGDPWTGWDTAITWTAGIEYYFGPGYFSYAVAPNWALNGIRIIGAGSRLTRLIYTGTGDVVTFDAGPGVSNSIINIHIEGFLIKGTVSALSGVFVRKVGFFEMDDVSVVDVTVAGFRTDGCITGTVRNFRCDGNEGEQTFLPQYSILLDGVSLPTNNLTFINPVLGAVTQWNIKLINAGANIFIGGAFESAAVGAIWLNPGANSNSFTACYVTGETRVQGCGFNNFIGMVQGAPMNLLGAQNTHLIGGQYSNITIDNACVDTDLGHLMYGYGAGDITDNGIRTSWRALYKYHADTSAGFAPDVIRGGAIWKGPDMTSQIQIGELNPFPTFGALSFNGSLVLTAMKGLYGNASDNHQYYTVPTGGKHMFQINGAQLQLSTGVSHTVDDVITKLQALGLFSQ